MEPERIKGLFGQANARTDEFKKETYAESFREFLEDNGPVWDMVSGAENGGMPPQEREAARKQAADAFAQGAQEMVNALKGRIQREKMQCTLNLYMVSYVLPAILAWQERRGIREEETGRLTDAICGRWQACFGTHIQASGFESVMSGFKQKLCFVTTAVCRGLQKPQDCKEIVLMKQFRDGFFSGNAKGRLLIQEYYDIAPTIVKRIEREADPEEKYLYLWNTYIKKCVDYIERGQNEQCGRLYKAMMSELKEEYMVTDRHRHER